jgi:hypothetical protein
MWVRIPKKTPIPLIARTSRDCACRSEVARVVIALATSRSDFDEQLARCSHRCWWSRGNHASGTILCSTGRSAACCGRCTKSAEQATGNRCQASLIIALPIESMPLELQPICNRLNDLLGRLESAFVRQKRFSSQRGSRAAHANCRVALAGGSVDQMAGGWQSLHRSDSGCAGHRAADADIVDALLALARCEDGRQTLSWRPVNLRKWSTMCGAPRHAAGVPAGIDAQLDDIPERDHHHRQSAVELDPGQPAGKCDRLHAQGRICHLLGQSHDNKITLNISNSNRSASAGRPAASFRAVLAQKSGAQRFGTQRAGIGAGGGLCAAAAN